MKVFKKVFICLTVLALAVSCASEGGSSGAAKKVEHLEWISFTQAELEQSKKNLEAGDPIAKHSLEALIELAEASMLVENYSVMKKTLVADSGDKRDYLSLSPYWWPDPNQPDGRPYIRIDGVTNPEVRGEGTDKEALELMTLDVYNLGIAYYFTGDEKYAQKAAELTRVWFLDEATYMNPNAKYGQGVYGRAPGRANALIETRHLLKIIDSMLLLQHLGSPAWTQKDMDGLRAWFTEFVAWMYDSPICFAEDNTTNNHAVWYNAQLVGFLLFTGQFDLAKQELRTALRRERPQFASAGHQPEEAVRTRSYHYHCFALAAWAHLIRYGILIDYPIHYKNPLMTSSRNVLRGVRYMLPFISKQSEWGFPELAEPEFVKALQFLPLLREAFLPRNYHLYSKELEDPYFKSVASSTNNLGLSNLNETTTMLFAEFPEHKEILLFPIMP